jgi:RNA polymerase sigma factor (sigma-70 family)
MTNMTETLDAKDDAHLIAESLMGHREAFGLIVERYKTLICSLAYARTGDLSQSEDLAQETFVAAWKQLGNLREPQKLKSWLCGIARNLTCDAVKHQGREPSHAAETLDCVDEIACAAPLPREIAISSEEQAILWKSIELIPEIYRAPLVLFYRENQSVEAVAQSLEVSEEVVRQRLSRGRKLLTEQVLAFVEGALAKTSPSREFTRGVLAALPISSMPVKIATLGSAMAKGGAIIKGAASAGAMAGALPFLGGLFFSIREREKGSKSEKETHFMRKWGNFRIVFTVIMLFAMNYAQKSFKEGTYEREMVVGGFVLVCAIFGALSYLQESKRRREIQMEDGTYVDADWKSPRRVADDAANEPGGKQMKALRVMASIGLVVMVFMVARAPWHTLPKVVMITVAMLVVTYWSYQSWQNRPRYQTPRIGVSMALAGVFGAATLGMFNYHQYWAMAGRSMAPTWLVVAFDVAIAMGYGTLIGVLAWWRRNVGVAP